MPVGVMDFDRATTPPEGVRWLGCGRNQVSTVVAENHPDCIVVGMMERTIRQPIQQLVDLRFAGVQIEDAAATYATIFHRVSVRELRPSQLVFSLHLGPRLAMVAVQTAYSTILGAGRSCDHVADYAGRCHRGASNLEGTDFRPANRSGKYGVPFTLYKFRSMRVDRKPKAGRCGRARTIRALLPWGRRLRKLRVDELPQLFRTSFAAI